MQHASTQPISHLVSHYTNLALGELLRAIGHIVILTLVGANIALLEARVRVELACLRQCVDLSVPIRANYSQLRQISTMGLITMQLGLLVAC